MALGPTHDCPQCGCNLAPSGTLATEKAGLRGVMLPVYACWDCAKATSEARQPLRFAVDDQGRIIDPDALM
jgi:hypothetical protein